jgi:hypothetical protein
LLSSLHLILLILISGFLTHEYEGFLISHESYYLFVLFFIAHGNFTYVFVYPLSRSWVQTGLKTKLENSEDQFFGFPKPLVLIIFSKNLEPDQLKTFPLHN